jgi:hypothetical protein
MQLFLFCVFSDGRIVNETSEWLKGAGWLWTGSWMGEMGAMLLGGVFFF